MSSARHDDSRDDERDTLNDDVRNSGRDAARDAHHAADVDESDDEVNTEKLEPTSNPPRTTKGWFTAPKFGSASSGGGEIEPGPEKD